MGIRFLAGEGSDDVLASLPGRYRASASASLLHFPRPYRFLTPICVPLTIL
ncbi:hypothetical protein RRSWK_05643 [Rhodopirellula sp. SWK7]|nr:hypothetical protein RRSWK_05643 [Rhodopirellula sp. SWK7]